MNDGIMDSIHALMAEVNVEELWERFFSEFEVNEEFNERLDAYRSLSTDIDSYNEEINDYVAQDWYDSYSSIKNQQKALRNEIEEINTVLNNRKLEPVQISLYQKAIEDREKEINRLQGEYRKNSVYKNRAKELSSLLNEAMEKREEWKNMIDRSFVSIKFKMLNKLRDDRANLNVQRKELRKKLLIAEDNLENKKIEYNNLLKNYGTNNAKTIEAYHSLVEADVNCNNIRKEIGEFNVKILNLDANVNNYIEFLEDMSFEKFWERFEKNNYSFNNTINISEPIINVEPVVEEKNDDIYLKAVEDAKKRQEEAKEALNNIDNNFENEWENAYEDIAKQTPIVNPQPVVAQSNDDIYLKAVEDAKKRQEEVKEALNEIDNKFESEWMKAYEKQQKKADKKAKKEARKIERIKDANESLREKIGKKLLSFKEYLERPLVNPITNNGNRFNLSGRELQMSLSDSNYGNTVLQVITSIAENNNHVKRDGKLLSGVKERIKNNFKRETRETQNHNHYAELYEKVNAMNNYDARNWFKNVSIKEQLLKDIKENCGLSKEEMEAFEEKVNAQYYLQVERTYRNLMMKSPEEVKEFYNNLSSKEEFLSEIRDVCHLSDNDYKKLLDKLGVNNDLEIGDAVAENVENIVDGVSNSSTIHTAAGKR